MKMAGNLTNKSQSGLSHRADSGGAMGKPIAGETKRAAGEWASETPGPAAPSIRGRNMSVRCARAAVGQVPEHAHETLQISVLFEPATCVLRWPAKRGGVQEKALTGPALAMLAPGQAHAWEWQREGDTIVLQLDGRLYHKLIRGRPAAVVIAAPVAARDLMVWQFANVLRQLCFAGDSSEIPLLGLVAESIARRIAAIIGRATAAPARSLTAALLKQVEEFVRAQLAYDIHVDDLARCVGYSVPHFSELFKVAMGMTPSDYIFEQRMVRAEGLLRSGNYLIGQVARLVGYFDQGHFTGLFRDYFGYTPKLVLQQARVDSANRHNISA
jgi:AraC family transcriptional regulator